MTLSKEEEVGFKPVPGTRSPISWVGGKSRLVKHILPLLPVHTCYCEVFAGAAWMLFRKPESKVEMINDINRDLITLYRVVKHHLDELVRQFRWLLISRDEFQRFLETPADVLTDIQRAARFYYLMRTGFGGKAVGQTFGYATTAPPGLNLLRVEQDLSDAHLRLARVYIENQTWERVLDRYDRRGTFFYLDPPYYGCENDYGKEIFSRDDFSRLADCLASVKGNFILSLNDKSEVSEIFRRFGIRKVSTRYCISKGSGAPISEVLISNCL
jgi:DNA adenine methylase